MTTSEDANENELVGLWKTLKIKWLNIEEKCQQKECDKEGSIKGIEDKEIQLEG